MTRRVNASAARFVADGGDRQAEALDRQRTAPHRCHAIGCDEAVPPALLMCSRHWRLVPRVLQREVWQAYRKGQEIDKRPSAAYLTAAGRAIAAVAEIERRQGRPHQLGLGL